MSSWRLLCKLLVLLVLPAAPLSAGELLGRLSEDDSPPVENAQPVPSAGRLIYRVICSPDQGDQADEPDCNQAPLEDVFHDLNRKALAEPKPVSPVPQLPALIDTVADRAAADSDQTEPLDHSPKRSKTAKHETKKVKTEPKATHKSAKQR